MVHPNYAATDFVLEKFTQTFLTEEAKALLPQLKALSIAGRHRASHPGTLAHQKFLKTHLAKAESLQEAYPYLNFRDEIDFFGKQMQKE